MSIVEINDYVKQLGYITESCSYYHLMPDCDLDGGLRSLANDNDVVDMFACHFGRRTISIYIDHLVPDYAPIIEDLVSDDSDDSEESEVNFDGSGSSSEEGVEFFGDGDSLNGDDSNGEDILVLNTEKGIGEGESSKTKTTPSNVMGKGKGVQINEDEGSDDENLKAPKSDDETESEFPDLMRKDI